MHNQIKHVPKPAADNDGFQVVQIKSRKVYRRVQKPTNPPSGLVDVLPMRNEFNILEDIDKQL